jgi:hypothetical protein
MRITVLVTIAALALRGYAASPLFKEMHYVGEIGHLDTDEDRRTSVNLGIAKAVNTESGIRLEGKDDHGKVWHASIPIDGGIGWTDVWIADFDGNSRQDLLIASFFPPSGRCLDPIRLTFLMIDSGGRPVPWSIETNWPKAIGEGRRPALLVDANHTGRAELIATECQYAAGVGADVNRRIIGIYEAKNAYWELMHPQDLSPFSAVFRANHRESSHVHLLAPNLADKRDLGNHPIPGISPVTLKEVQPPRPECSHAVYLPPLVNGVLQPFDHDPCDELRYSRLMFSDGSTCYCDGALTVVFDGSEGREILEVESEKRLDPILREVIGRRAQIILAGQKIPGRCSPVEVWASGP